MARVSVTVSQKPKPEKTFKFLRRDEGRLSYSYAPGSTPNAGTTPSTPRHASPNSESASEKRKALKDAIANDMHQRKGHDPFSDVLIAVPKKAPPPNLVTATNSNNTNMGEGGRSNASGDVAAPAGAATGKARVPPPPRQPVKRREWVDVEVPPPPPPAPPAQASTPRDGAAAAAGAEEGAQGRRQASQHGSAYQSYADQPDRAASAERQAGGGYRSHHLDDDYYRRPAYADPNREMGAAPPPSRGHYEDDAVAVERYGTAGPGASSSAAIRRPASAPRRFDDDYAGGGYGGYFHRTTRPHSVGPSSLAEEQVVQQLERELEAARYEREHFLDAKRQLEEERKRFDAYRAAAQGDLDYAKSRLEADRKEMQRDAQKDSRSLEERHRATTTLLEQERENNKRLTQENDLLTAQLNELTSAMRESQRVQKAEIARLRRDVESLTHRNRELLAMARQSQIEALEAASQEHHSDDNGVTALIPGSTNSHMNGSVAVPPLQLLSASSAPQSGVRTRSGSVTERQKAALKSKTHGGTGALAEVEANSFASRSDELRQRREDAARRQQEEGATPTKKDLAKQRAGHPVTTPRVKSSTASHSQPPAVGGTAVGLSIPTKEDLLGDVEPIPTTEFPNDAIVSRNALGQNPNKREVLYRSGKREIHYANGTTKIVLPTGHSILNFVNGDIKRTYPNGRSTYWYDEAKTMHTQLPDGTELFEFHATGQTERHLPNGEKDILYPDGIYKVVRVDGTDETFFPPNAIGAKSVAS